MITGTNILEADENLQEPQLIKKILFLKTSLGGGGYRRMKEKFLFSNNLNNILPQMLDVKDSSGQVIKKGLWNSLKTILGEDSFSSENREERWKAFYESGLPMAKALKEEWLGIKDLTNQLQMETSISVDNMDATCSNEYSFGFGIKKLSSNIRKGI